MLNRVTDNTNQRKETGEWDTFFDNAVFKIVKNNTVLIEKKQWLIWFRSIDL